MHELKVQELTFELALHVPTVSTHDPLAQDNWELN